MDTPPPSTPNQVLGQSPRPSRRWYLLALLLLLGSLAVFVTTLVGKQRVIRDAVEPMPRFVGPTGEDGFVVNIDQPGKITIFHENIGELDGRSFNTPRRQVWTTFDQPSMTCKVTRVDSGEALEVRLPGVGEEHDKTKPTRDLVYTYKLPGRAGHGAWVFDVDLAGEYRIVLDYVDAVRKEPGDIEIPPELTKQEKKKITAEEGKALETARRDALERASLAQLEPIDVLFAVGPDPTAGGFFEVIGLKGAATVLAFGFTFAVLITLVVFMLRNGHVTPRGEISDVKRGVLPQRDA